MQNISREEALRLLNAPDRLDNLRKLVADAKAGKLPLPTQGEDVNNHIHTTYSFSPYSPTAAVWFAWQAGLCTAGIMDHDSIAGAPEFLEACEIVGIMGTIGIECRVSMAETSFGDVLINNPDQVGCSYAMIHSVPHNQWQALNDHFAPYREKRNARNRKMVDAVNQLMGQHGIAIDFDADVLPLSAYDVGGTVTERHLSAALAQKMIDKIGKGQALVDFIRGTLQLPLSPKIEAFLLDERNENGMYDLLGWIKSELISKFYIPATDELMTAKALYELSERIHGIGACSYLGDVGDSITGDKKAQKFEDSFLDELLACYRQIGFKALTYAPSRNTKAQFDRLRELCDRLGLLQISGEDINSPRQSFVCVQQRDPQFRNLYLATWAMIAHERLAAQDPDKGFFSEESVRKWPVVADRVDAFSKMGLAMRR